MSDGATSTVERPVKPAVRRAPVVPRAEPYRFGDAHELVRELGVTYPMAAALCRRNARTPADARALVEVPEVWTPPKLPSARKAAEEIYACAQAGRPITIHGDYDADGVCGTTVMVKWLRALGAKVDWYLPSRFEDGYGLSAETVCRLAGRGTKLIATVDCGIGSRAEIRAARELGVEVVVTDHHALDGHAPECTVVHPALDRLPAPHPCGAAVAWLVAREMLEVAGRNPAEADADLDLVALATVADVVELTGCNRSFVQMGIKTMAATEKPGLQALMRVARLDPEALDARAIGFRLAPRINAAGRMTRADAGVELFLCEHPERADEIAADLDRINSRRRIEEADVRSQAEAVLREMPAGIRDARAIVVAGEGWNAGVIGIVAGRLADEYARPTVVIALDGDRGRGSARSIEGFDLLEALRACSEHLVKFGGHRQAAGLEIDPSDIEAFQEEFLAYADSVLGHEESASIETVDAVVDAAALGLPLAQELRRLGPFGQGNPEPRLLVPAAKVEDVQTMGEGRHMRFRIESGGASAKAVAFGTGPRLKLGDGPRHDLSVALEVNRWNGSVEGRPVLKRVLSPIPTDIEERPQCQHCAGDDAADAWWEAVLAWEQRAGERSVDPPDSGGSRTEIAWDRTSALAVVTELVSTGESVAIVCAHAERRLGTLRRDLGAFREVLSQCRRCFRTSAADPGKGVTVLDHARASIDLVGLTDPTHVVVLDPPPSDAAAAALGAGPRDSFLHAVYGTAECDFALWVNDRYRAPETNVRALYRLLSESEISAAHVTEHPTPPDAAWRALSVLREMGAVTASESDAPGRGRIHFKKLEERVDLNSLVAFTRMKAEYEARRRYLQGKRASCPPAVPGPSAYAL